MISIIQFAFPKFLTNSHKRQILKLLHNSLILQADLCTHQWNGVTKKIAFLNCMFDKEVISFYFS